MASNLIGIKYRRRETYIPWMYIRHYQEQKDFLDGRCYK